MRSKLLLLNLALLVLIGAAVRQWRANWRASRVREAQLLRMSLPALPTPHILVPAAPAVVSAVPYLEVASQLLLSKDRNPNVIIEAAPEVPMPPLPRFYGVMSFPGDPAYIILAERVGAPQHKYQVGEKIGEFKIAKLGSAGLTFEWGNKTVSVAFADIQDRSESQSSGGSGGGASAPPPSSTPAQSGLTSLSSVSPKPTNTELSPTSKACASGDASPDGTTADGYRKVVTKTPFGSQCRWEQIR